MIEETDWQKGDQFPASRVEGACVTYEKQEDGLWKLMTPHVCAFLNTRGGTILVGVKASLEIVGITIQNKDVDNIGLRFDSHLNGISPQPDAREISCTFFRLRDAPMRGVEGEAARYVIAFVVGPGTKTLYYTSYLFKQTFRMTPMGPRTLNRDEIRMRNQNTREFCLQLEEFNQTTDIFVDNLAKIRAFVQDESFAQHTNVVQIFGNQGSGRSSCLNKALEGHFSEGWTLIQVDFERLSQFEDIYLQILKQLDSDITGLTEKELDALSVEHHTMKKRWEIHQDEGDEQDFLFSLTQMDTSMPRYYRLYNILNNAVLDYNKRGMRVVFAFFNATRFVLELIPTHPCAVLFTTSNNILLQPSIGLRALSLKSRRLTPEQLQAYFALNGHDVCEQHIETLLEITGGNFPKILKIVSEYASDLGQFLATFSSWSQRKKLAYFGEHGQFQVPNVLIKPLACLAIFPDVFTYEMMESLLTAAQGGAVDKLINSLQPFLYKSKGKFFIAPAMRSYVLQQVDSAFGVNVCFKMVDAMMEELRQINVQFERMQQIKQDIADGVSRVDSAYLLSLGSMTLNNWICDFGSTLDACVDQVINLKYRMNEMQELLNVFAGLKISADKARKLRRMVRASQEPSQQ